MPGNIFGVVGTDGIQPVYQPEARWCFWGLHEIYVGQQGENRYVPKVNDYVVDYGTYTTYIVDHIDPITLVATLREKRPANMSFTFAETDILFGVGPGTQSDTYRMYVDKSVMPYRACIDQRLRVAGTATSYAKIFKGSDLAETGKVISKVFNNSGMLVTQNVALEIAAIDSHVNYSIKTVVPFYTTEELIDGEIVTAVFYSDNGHVVSKRQLLVENTAFIRSVNVSTKYVTNISLESPFLSLTQDNLIELPLNVPMNSMNLTGVVHYSDGTMMKLPVNGTKFKLLGLGQMVSSIVGQQLELVLSYVLGTNEVAFNGVTSDGKYINENYKLQVINPNNSYAVKLFCYPVWINSINGYSLQWWLYNLDRNTYFDVTSLVTFSPTTGPYNSKAYGQLQRKSVSINLKNVSGAFKSFVHTQLVDIVLYGEPQNGTTAWTVAHESIADRPVYGEDIEARKISAQVLNFGNEFNTVTEWKENIYRRIYPLTDNTSELSAPDPTHFIAQYATVEVEVPITNWNDDVNFGSNITDYKSVNLRFIKRTPNGDLQLGVASMVIKP